MHDKKILVLHGRQDVTIPFVGGADSDNAWIYEPGKSMIADWAI